MNGLAATLETVSKELKRLKANFALVGGLAVAARARTRYTADVDIAVAVHDDREAEALISALFRSGFQVRALIEQEAADRLATVRLEAPEASGPPVTVDLLFASCGIEPEVVRDASTTTVLPRISLPVAQIGHLIAMKLLAESDLRPTDRQDLLELLGKADAGEVERARQAVDLIVQRGFNRGRDLSQSLDKWLTLSRGGMNG